MTLFGSNSTTTLLANTILGQLVTLKMHGSNGSQVSLPTRYSWGYQLLHWQQEVVSFLLLMLHPRCFQPLRVLLNMEVLCCGQGIMMFRVVTALLLRNMFEIKSNNSCYSLMYYICMDVNEILTSV